MLPQVLLLITQLEPSKRTQDMLSRKIRQRPFKEPQVEQLKMWLDFMEATTRLMARSLAKLIPVLALLERLVSGVAHLWKALLRELISQRLKTKPLEHLAITSSLEAWHLMQLELQVHKQWVRQMTLWDNNHWTRKHKHMDRDRPWILTT